MAFSPVSRPLAAVEAIEEQEQLARRRTWSALLRRPPQPCHAVLGNKGAIAKAAMTRHPLRNLRFFTLVPGVSFMLGEQTEAKINLRSKWDDFWGPFKLPGEVVTVAFGKQSMEQMDISVPVSSQPASLDETGSGNHNPMALLNP